MWSETFEQHLKDLGQIFSLLAEQGFQLKLSKCSFFQEKVHFLGFMIASGSISVDPSKLSAITDFAAPETVEGLQRFLGMIGWYRRFIRGFSEIAAPPFELLRTENRHDRSKWKISVKRH